MIIIVIVICKKQQQQKKKHNFMISRWQVTMFRFSDSAQVQQQSWVSVWCGELS